MKIDPENVTVTDHCRKQYRVRVLSELYDIRTVNRVTEKQITGLIKEAVSQSKHGKRVREQLAPWLSFFHQERGKQRRDIYYHPETHAVFLVTSPTIDSRSAITCFRATCKQCYEHECKCGSWSMN